METHLRDLAVRQARMASVHVVVANSASRNEDSTIENVHVIRVGRLATIASMPVCPGLSRAIGRIPTDLVHLHTPNPGAAFALLRSRHKGRLIVTHHADILGRKGLRRYSDPYVQRVMERAAAIIVTSERYLRTSDELAPFRDKCHVLPLGIELPSCESGNDSQLPADVELPMILAVGRLVPYKGFDILIQAMKQVNATLWLIGSGPQAESLRQLIQSEGVAHKVKLLGTVSDLQPCFRAASMFVLPSVTRAEAFGLAQLEAMATGIPVVNTNIDSGVPEISVHGETGLTVEPSDVQGLADAINNLLENGALRQRMGEAARVRVRTRYTADRMAQATWELYQQVLASG
jgi:rhamnosyl/mannosyltransferase